MVYFEYIIFQNGKIDLEYGLLSATNTRDVKSEITQVFCHYFNGSFSSLKRKVRALSKEERIVFILNSDSKHYEKIKSIGKVTTSQLIGSVDNSLRFLEEYEFDSDLVFKKIPHATHFKGL